MKTRFLLILLLGLCWPLLGQSQSFQWGYSVAPNAGWLPGTLIWGYQVQDPSECHHNFACDGVGGGAFIFTETVLNSAKVSVESRIRVIWLDRRGKLVMDSDSNAGLIFAPDPEAAAAQSNIGSPIFAAIMRVTASELVMSVTYYSTTNLPTETMTHFIVSRGGVTRRDVPISALAGIAFQRLTNDPGGYFSLTTDSTGTWQILRYSYAIPQ